MSNNVKNLLNEYKETRRCLEMGIEWLPENDFAKAKLEVVNMIIADLENIEA
ncbi:MAG: hypothetical protein ACRDDY_15990 [Clostridium sp.]|uniref:hypothetical protein n=1 Tax=Clostridium sp. TaxID=1506 RepID=UPI003EE6DD1B